MKTPRGFKSVPAKEVKAVEAEVVRILNDLRCARRRQGYTQATLAEELSFSTVYVASIEIGDRLPSLPTLIRMAKVLGMTIKFHKE